MRRYCHSIEGAGRLIDISPPAVGETPSHAPRRHRRRRRPPLLPPPPPPPPPPTACHAANTAPAQHDADGVAWCGVLRQPTCSSGSGATGSACYLFRRRALDRYAIVWLGLRRTAECSQSQPTGRSTERHDLRLSCHHETPAAAASGHWS